MKNANDNLPAAAGGCPPCRMRIMRVAFLVVNSFSAGIFLCLCLTSEASLPWVLGFMFNVIAVACLAFLISQGSPDGETPQAEKGK